MESCGNSLSHHVFLPGDAESYKSIPVFCNYSINNLLIFVGDKLQRLPKDECL
jgi:hypothetical protein